MNKFIITFDSGRLDQTNQKHFEMLLTNHKLLSGWSSPFPGMYFVAAETEDAEAISDSIEDFFDKKGIFVARLSKGHSWSNGRLPAAFWEFLRDNS